MQKEQLGKYYEKREKPHEKEQVITDDNIKAWKEEDEKNEQPPPNQAKPPHNQSSDFNTPFGL